MASNNNTMTFSIGAYALLGVLFGLAAMLSMNASAAYADCSSHASSGVAHDCLTLHLQPQLAGLSGSEVRHDLTLAAANSVVAVLTPPAHSLAAPSAQGAGFYVNQSRNTDQHLSETLPLLLLLVGLVAVFLIRAKSLNNK